MQHTILYVDPAAEERDRFEEAVRQQDGLKVRSAADLDAAMELLDETVFDIVVSETAIGTDAVQELFERARETERPLPCLLFTDQDISDIVDSGIILAASAVRSKDGDDAYNELAEELHTVLRPRSELDYPVPADEDERVRAADQIDIRELREREAFDQLTRIARALFDVRYAFVGIVQDDTEEFISFGGADVDSLPRECSICTFGILDGETTIVDDSRADARFRYIEELEELEIVFYAGHPIIDDDGHRIGMFCITDDTPREFDAEDRELLRLFAEQASELIRLYGVESDGYG